MKKLIVFVSLIFCFVFLLPLSGAFANDVDYTISHYDATFELVPNNLGELCDVAVTLEITYNIKQGCTLPTN